MLFDIGFEYPAEPVHLVQKEFFKNIELLFRYAVTYGTFFVMYGTVNLKYTNITIAHLTFKLLL